MCGEYKNKLLYARDLMNEISEQKTRRKKSSAGA